ncbi:MAG: NAD-dependent epimerase/dehydratase family protein [Alphaproteobacteria bacterium]|nr:NAD-dependent epimerase/dehydratase family protein [Alphaproteobacteria bacterium]
MSVLVTGVAGFIGFHTAKALIARGETVLGVDNLNDYYDVALKNARLDQLAGDDGFTFEKLDLAEPGAVAGLFASHKGITRVLHFAAQAGVRYSLTHPDPYIESNIVSHLHVLEACRHASQFEHLVYASSSSVYGANEKLPFSVEDRVDRPVSLYAATKRAGELMSQSYAHLYRLPQTGLRFFTVYGPWGRPDMSAYIFTRAIFEGRPIEVFNRGDMKRDFTYVDDIIDGVLAALDRPPGDDANLPPHRLYNLGNHCCEPLLRFIETIEKAAGRKAELRMAEMQPGEVKETYADIEASRRDLGFEPSTPIDEGVPKFVAWYREYHGV